MFGSRSENVLIILFVVAFFVYVVVVFKPIYAIWAFEVVKSGSLWG